MESPQSVVSPLKQNGNLSNGAVSRPKEHHNSIGVLDVYVHQARDIHNICIYHKQDVYAKLCLTSSPETAVSTKIINGGGRNPVFDDNLRLDVLNVDCSLKCEIFMMSRVKNYLEDQLLGFTLVPVSEVIIKNGKLEKEFSLSSTDLFHSPAGFVQLSISYTGVSPDVMAIPPPIQRTAENSRTIESIPSELDKIEFPDPNIVNENRIMVSEYIGISENSETLIASDASATTENIDSESRVLEVKSFSPAEESNGESSPSVEISSDSSDPQTISKMPNPENISDLKSNGESDELIVKPVLTVNIEPEEQSMVQQDIVDMYMNSMKQFTESLAKMKLPLDIDSPTKSGNSSSSSDQKIQTPKSASSRVFYGSRAFF